MLKTFMVFTKNMKDVTKNFPLNLHIFCKIYFDKYYSNEVLLEYKNTFYSTNYLHPQEIHPNISTSHFLLNNLGQ